MTLSVHQKGFFYTNAIIIFVWMCISNQTMYTHFIPYNLILVLSIVQMVFLVVVAGNNKSPGIAQLLFLVAFMSFLFFYKHPEKSVFKAITSLGYFSTISAILLLSPKDKKALLELISNIMVVLLSISMIGWLIHLFVSEIPIFEYVDLNDDLHYLSNNYVFYDNANRISNIFPRFRGFFIEPGQLATPCLYLFFARGANFSEKKDVILLISIFLSFSLAGYVVLLLGLLLKYLFTEVNMRNAKLIGFVLVVGSISFYTVKYANEDNPLVSFIIERLEYDEDIGIVGNNRSDEDFDNHFSNYLKTDKIIWGMRDEIKIGYQNWTNHASGIKKYFVFYGVMGVLVMLLLTVLLLKRNYCRATLVFFCVIWMAFLVRDMLQTLFWLIIAILGFYNLKEESRRVQTKLSD